MTCSRFALAEAPLVLIVLIKVPFSFVSYLVTRENPSYAPVHSFECFRKEVLNSLSC